MAYKSKLGPTLHVRTCRVTVPYLKNGWTDCAQIWYTIRDRLVGCRAQAIGGTPAQFRTCKAHYLARSVGRPKRRYTGFSKYVFCILISLSQNPKLNKRYRFSEGEQFPSMLPRLMTSKFDYYYAKAVSCGFNFKHGLNYSFKKLEYKHK